MEIKDIAVRAEHLEDVRGGQSIDVASFGGQLGLNAAGSEAYSFGLGNSTASSVVQAAPQAFRQETAISAVDVDRDVLGVFNSWVL